MLCSFRFLATHSIFLQQYKNCVYLARYLWVFLVKPLLTLQINYEL